MPTIKASFPISQCENWIASNPCPPNEDGAPRVAHWIYKASLAFKLRRLSTETARPLIEKHMTREPRPGEIEQAIPRAYEQEFNGNSSRTSEPKAEYDPAKLERIANRINFDVTPEWLEARSPRSCWNRTPAGFLHALRTWGADLDRDHEGRSTRRAVRSRRRPGGLQMPGSLEGR